MIGKEDVGPDLFHRNSIFMACQLETTEYSTEGCIIKSVLTKVLRKPPIGFCKNLFFGQVSNESDLGSCN